MPQFLSCKQRCCQTLQWGESGFWWGLHSPNSGLSMSPWDPRNPRGQGQHSRASTRAQCAPSTGGWDRVSVTSLGAPGEWPEQGGSPEGTAPAAGSLDPGAGFSPVSSQLQPSELTPCLFGERVSGRHLDGGTPPPALTRSFALRPGAAASPLCASVSPSAEVR